MIFKKLSESFAQQLELEIFTDKLDGEPLGLETAQRLLEVIREFLNLGYGDEEDLLDDINCLVVEAFNNNIVSEEFIPFAADEIFRDRRHLVRTS